MKNVPAMMTYITRFKIALSKKQIFDQRYALAKMLINRAY